MEVTIALAISILSIVFTILNFAIARKKDAIQETKENNHALIQYRLDELDKNVQKILDKLDKYEVEVDEKIEKAIKNHIAIYHKK